MNVNRKGQKPTGRYADHQQLQEEPSAQELEQREQLRSFSRLLPFLKGAAARNNRPVLNLPTDWDAKNEPSRCA